jgi:hypothetical protein
MFKRAIKAQVIVYYIQGLACTVYSLFASALYKAVVTCVLSFILYRTEAWYTKQRKLSQVYISGFVSVYVK